MRQSNIVNSRLKVLNPSIELQKRLSTEECFVYRGLDVIVPFADDSIYEFTKDIQDADIICWGLNFSHKDYKKDVIDFINKIDSTQILVNIDHLMHSSEHYSLDSTLLRFADIDSILVENNKKGLLLHTNKEVENLHPRIVYTDFLWNRQQVFYNYQPDCIFKISQVSEQREGWYPFLNESNPIRKKDIYELSDLDLVCSTDFLFKELSNEILYRLYLSPNKIRGASELKNHLVGFKNQPVEGPQPEVRDFLRMELADLLKNWPGYLGELASGYALIGNSTDHLYQTISAYESFGWFPIHNAYYDHSIISIYIETITFVRRTDSSVRVITEKTLEPLIRGHFILPFGYQGLIEDIKSYGFQLPDWIDYKYDIYESDLERWFKYNKEVRRVLNLGDKKLRQLKARDKEILKHNRELFFELGYKDTIFDALSKANMV